jgi:hypothetical protein
MHLLTSMTIPHRGISSLSFSSPPEAAGHPLLETAARAGAKRGSELPLNSKLSDLAATRLNRLLHCHTAELSEQADVKTNGYEDEQESQCRVNLFYLL